MRILNCVKGITLTELVVVMAVLSVLASVSLPILRVSVKRAKEMTLRRELRTMRDGIDYYKKLHDEGRISSLNTVVSVTASGNTGYPKTLEDLTSLIPLLTVAPPPAPAPGAAPVPVVPPPTKIRILRRIPVDPMTGTAEWGMRSNEDEPDSSTWGGQDVFDVYSLSEETALDGTKYKDW